MSNEHVLAYGLGAVCLVIIPQVKCDTTWNSVLLILAMTFNGAVFSGLNSTRELLFWQCFGC